MENGFTPGPWAATFSFPGLTPGIGDTWQIDCDGHAVCTTQFCYAPNTEANARLIASAPDLYEALKLVRMSFGWQTLSDETKAVIDAALSKAVA